MVSGSGTAQEGFSGGLRVKHTTPTLLRPESLVNQGFSVLFVLPGNSHLTLYVTPGVRLL